MRFTPLHKQPNFWWMSTFIWKLILCKILFIKFLTGLYNSVNQTAEYKIRFRSCPCAPNGMVLKHDFQSEQLKVLYYNYTCDCIPYLVFKHRTICYHLLKETRC